MNIKIVCAKCGCDDERDFYIFEGEVFCANCQECYGMIQKYL